MEGARDPGSVDGQTRRRAGQQLRERRSSRTNRGRGDIKMTSQISSPLHREAVELEARKTMTFGQKFRRWIECGRVCMVCHKLCEPVGLGVVWDHRVALALGGSNDLSNMEPHHAGLCAASKTARDRRAIAKAHRLAGETCASPTKRPIRSRGFDKRLTKGFDGKVRERNVP